MFHFLRVLIRICLCSLFVYYTQHPWILIRLSAKQRFQKRTNILILKNKNDATLTATAILSLLNHQFIIVNNIRKKKHLLNDKLNNLTSALRFSQNLALELLVVF